MLDSKLVVEQLLGRWRVKEPSLQPLWAQARALLSQIGRWSARQEGRANNRQADAMANLALDDPAAAALVEAGDCRCRKRRARVADPSPALRPEPCSGLRRMRRSRLRGAVGPSAASA